MPPPMPNPSKRMTAQPSRPVARYRPGKAVAEEESSDEEESENESQQQPQKRPTARSQPPRAPARAQPETDDDEDEEGFITDPEDEGDGGAQTSAVKPSVPVIKSTTGPSTLKPPPDDDQDAESAEASSEQEPASESESAESSSSEDEPKRKFQRPIFLKKTDRNYNPANNDSPIPTTISQPTPAVDDHARRIAETDILIADKIQRDALARAAGKKAWDDDDEVIPESQVDDTDNLDPEGEHQAWRLRELTRLKRDREAMIAREKEIEELERRRNLTAQEREKEDKEFLDKQKEERDEGRGQSGYLAKYHHKGAFFQDDEAAEILKRRDVMGAKFVDDVADKSVLPEYMRIRDMTKLGRKGRTRYKDLKTEDTGRWGDEVKRWRGAGDTQGRGAESSMDLRGVDERFLPDKDRGGPNFSGANASAVGERKQRYRSRSRSRSRNRDKEREMSRSRSRSPRRNAAGNNGDSYRPTRRRSYSRSQSHSHSPPRRKRSPPSAARRDEEDERSKRRRVVEPI